MRRHVVCLAGLAVLVALAACGGGALTAEGVESKLEERGAVRDASCVETTEEGSDLPPFQCTAKYGSSGESATIVVVESDESGVTATVFVGGTIVDFFSLD